VVVKPLALFGVIVVVGLVAIGAMLHLTNNSASAKPPPLSPASAHALFVREGNGVCARYYDEVMAALEGRSIPRTAKAWAKWGRLAVPLDERLGARLRALVPPGPDARTDRRLLRVYARVLHNEHVLLHAYETGQLLRARLIVRQADHLSRRFNSLARKLGLTICGLDGHQIARRYG
jgi:hypothetical protein